MLPTRGLVLFLLYSDERRQNLCHMEVKDTILGKKEQEINARGRQNQLEIGKQLRGILENKFKKIESKQQRTISLKYRAFFHSCFTIQMCFVGLCYM